MNFRTRALRYAANRLGYELHRKIIHRPTRAADAKKPKDDSKFTTYRIALETLASVRRPLTIVQVGANDGLINDPLHWFVRAHREHTRIVLIEPQTFLIPHLTENYSFHPDAHVINQAVGPQDSLTLYAVSPDVWDRLEVPYARSWPSYRAPTGATSALRGEVVTWLAKFLPEGLDPEDHISTVAVSSGRLSVILEQEGLEARADILQIDAEGFDDEVIFAADLDRLRPNLILYEAHRLDSSATGHERHSRLKSFLRAQGYLLSRQGSDMLAVWTTPDREAVRAGSP